MNCKLCLKDKPLIKSHIIPKFLWKPLKRGGGKLHVLPAEPHRSEFKMQDGPKEPMLCKECDQQIGRYENYVRQVLYNKLTESDYGFQVTECDKGIRITNLDYDRFKLFQLAILWKAHESTKDFYRKVSLGNHAELIRLMLFEERPGLPTEYGCFVAGILEKPGKLFDEAIIEPEKIQKPMCDCYEFVMGGCLWFYFVTAEHPQFLGSDQLIGPTGEIIIPFRLWNETGLFDKYGRRFRK